MTLMQLDPTYVATQLRLLRKYLNLTQENVAGMAGLTTRTIEKIESGRHTPNEQTLKSLCRGLGIDTTAFIKPSPEEEARTNAEMTRALKKITVVPTTAIKSPNDFLLVRNGCHAFRFETLTVEGEEAQDIAATMVDYITDLMTFGRTSVPQRGFVMLVRLPICAGHSQNWATHASLASIGSGFPARSRSHSESDC